jgi:hypothetical protein
VWFRAFGFLPPGSPSAGVGRAAAEEVAGTLCKTVRARIFDTGTTLLGEMWYVHTGLNDPRITFLTASGNGDENERLVAYTVNPDNQPCVEAGYWTAPHLHEYHVDGASTFLLRNDGKCGATCQDRFPCAPSPANCPYNRQDWWNDWVRGFWIDDKDCDRFTDSIEQYLGTDPSDACPDNSWDDAWPLDINNDRWITVGGDVLNFRGRIGDTGPPRYDLNADGFITVGGDALLYRGRIGETCT